MSSERLSSLEAAFLALDSRDVPFVYASILHFERAIPVDALRSQVETALVDVPRLRQRMAPRLRGAAWVDDHSFRIDRHVRSITAGTPGGTEELEELVAKLIVGELSRAHPPWRLWTVRGLTGGRGAVIAVVHHALVDGIAGIRLLEHIVGGAPAPAPAEARPRAPVTPERPGASLGQLVSWSNFKALGKLLRDGLRPASQVGLNPRHTSRARAVASHTVDLEAVRQIERTFGVTNNDVVLATVAGALRRLLAWRGIDVDAAHDVRAMVPVGRHRGHPDELAGNRVVLLLSPLPIDVGDPVTCLRRISTTTRELKGGHTASAGDLLVALSDRTTPGVLAGVLRLALRMRAFNTLITNVPGPREKLALFGVPLTGITPIVNLWPHQALAIAATSYAGSLTFGLHADRAVLPHVAMARDALAASFTALLEAATTTQPSSSAHA